MSNLTFGDSDFRTLHIDGTTSIYKIRLLTGDNPCNSCSVGVAVRSFAHTWARPHADDDDVSNQRLELLDGVT